MIKRNTLTIQNNLMKTEDEAIDIDSKQYNDLLRIYEIAMNQVMDTLSRVKNRINSIYGYSIIENITGRVKTKESINKKLIKKNIPHTYVALVDNVNDIAGVRVICPIEVDIDSVVNIIKRLPNINVIEEKDYILNPKKSGYKAYHMIVETPVKINGETIVMKVEIQIRTSAMDFWAEMEHEIRYKSDKKMTKMDSKKLTWYATKLEKLQEKIIKLYRKQENNNQTISY